MKDYLGFHFTCHPKQPLSDALISELADLGFEAFEESPAGFAAYLPLLPHRESLVVEVRQCLHAYEALGQATFKVLEVKGENWNANWESNYPDVRVGNYIRVYAPFHESDPKVETEVIIAPQMSFGTGHHATTWLMLSFLKDLDASNLDVLDMGCGTGVLAIAAMLRGAKSAHAIDIEQNAVDNTIENARINGVNILVEKGNAGTLSQGGFDLIFANINRNILCADMPVYSKSLEEGGVLLLSGFFVSDADAIRSAAEACGLVLVSARNKDEWMAMKFHKAPK